jgi:hypothetical protein
MSAFATLSGGRVHLRRWRDEDRNAFAGLNSGLTRVMHNIVRRLADRHEIHYLGIGYSGEQPSTAA